MKDETKLFFVQGIKKIGPEENVLLVIKTVSEMDICNIDGLGDDIKFISRQDYTEGK